MDQSPTNAHSPQAATRAFNDEPATDGDDNSERGNFDNQLEVVEAERQSSAPQLPHARLSMSELLTESVASQQRRRMTDPPLHYKLQTEEIHVEPLTATSLQFPTTAQFERGVKLSRRATYTPSFVPTIQFNSSMSLKSIADPYRRASMGSRADLEPQSDKLEFDRYKEPTSPTHERWTPSKPNSSDKHHEPVLPLDNQSDTIAPSSTKASRRRRLSTAVGRWFK